MAWRNVWRNPRRTVLTTAAIAFASMLLVFMLSFQFGSYATMINSSVRIHSGHLQVQAQGYQEHKRIRQVVKQPARVRRMLAGLDGVSACTLRANAFSLASSQQRTSGVLVIGIEPRHEREVSTLPRLVRRGAYLDNQKPAGALVGGLLARNLKIGIGDDLTLLGQGRDGSIAATVLPVKGIFESGMDELDRGMVHIPLALFQDVYAMGAAVHEVVVLADSLGAVARIKQAAQSALSREQQADDLRVLDWKELVPGLHQGIQIDLFSGIIFYFILIVVVAFSILNTFLMAFFERTREFGVLMAIGVTPARLTRLLLLESTCLTLIGIAAGMVLGCLVTVFFEHYGISIAGASELLNQYGISGRIYPRLSVLSALSGPVAVWLITFAAAWYPAFKIRGLKPVEAMHYA
jgi:ABC-type lipoprotein release transport system permease subunit